jgi:hypothetical protein
VGSNLKDSLISKLKVSFFVHLLVLSMLVNLIIYGYSDIFIVTQRYFSSIRVVDLSCYEEPSYTTAAMFTM